MIIQSEGFLISPHLFECSAKNVLLLHQQLIIGIEVLYPLNEKLASTGINEREDIANKFKKYAEHIHFTFAFSLLDSKSESVLYGESSFVNTLGTENVEAKLEGCKEKKRYIILDDRIVFFKKTTLKLAPYFVSKVLKVTMSLSIPLKHKSTGIGANSIFVADEKEKELRYLLDRNRCRPTPISPLIISIGVEIANRITVTTSMRELSFNSTLITVSIENNFHANRVRITNCTVHLERSCDDQGRWCGGTFPSVFQIDYLTPHSDQAVVIEPQESYNLVYKVSFNSAQWALRGDNSLIDAHILGYFSTPVTVFYTTQLIAAPAPSSSQSPLELQLINLLLSDDINVASSQQHQQQQQAESPLDCMVNWSMGTGFVSTPLTAEAQRQMEQIASSLLNPRRDPVIPISNRNLHTKSSSSTVSHSDDGDGCGNIGAEPYDRDRDRDRLERGAMKLLDVYVEWPNNVVEVDASFTMKLLIVNRDSTYSFRDLVLMTCPATRPVDYVIQESIVKLRCRQMQNYWILIYSVVNHFHLRKFVLLVHMYGIYVYNIFDDILLYIYLVITAICLRTPLRRLSFM